MEMLYAPWRNGYSDSTDRTKHEDASSSECVFCSQFLQDNDKEHFILRRFDHVVVLLNRYPYNAGHLLILPTEHKSSIDDLLPEVQSELMWATGKSSTILKNILAAQGINIGINMGKIAGAGIPAHLHVHVLPRWNGDTNFLPTLGKIKVISYDLEDVYTKLKKPFQLLQR